MNSAQRRIACIGGIDVDCKARVKEPARGGTSNPVTVTSCTGGVAGNIARNLARLGCKVSLFSIVGNDVAGAGIRRELRELGIAMDGVAESSRQPTASYTAVLEPDGRLFIGLANMEIFEELTPEWADEIAIGLGGHPIWIFDANLPAATIARLLRLHKKEAIVLADPISVAKAEKLQGLLDCVDVVFPNRQEAGVLSGRKVESQDEVEAAAREIRRRGTKTVIVTLGEDGVYADDGRSGRFVAAIPPAKIVDVTGAGDALVAGYAYGMMSGGACDPVLFALAAASLALETEESVSSEMSPERVAERIEIHARRAAKQ